MKPYIVDASVAARFLLFEELSDRAILVLRDFLEESSDLMAPRLLVYEVGNTPWKAIRRDILSPEGGCKEAQAPHRTQSCLNRVRLRGA